MAVGSTVPSHVAPTSLYYKLSRGGGLNGLRFHEPTTYAGAWLSSRRRRRWMNTLWVCFFLFCSPHKKHTQQHRGLLSRCRKTHARVARIRGVKNDGKPIATAMCHTCHHTRLFLWLETLMSISKWMCFHVCTCKYNGAHVRHNMAVRFATYVHSVHKKHQTASGTAIKQWRFPPSRGIDLLADDTVQLSSLQWRQAQSQCDMSSSAASMS